jgi:hypothetical protein
MTPLDISPVPDEIWELPVPEKSTRKLIYFQQIEFEGHKEDRVPFHLLHGRAKTRRAGSMGFWAVFITHPGRAFELPSGRSSS